MLTYLKKTFLMCTFVLCLILYMNIKSSLLLLSRIQNYNAYEARTFWERNTMILICSSCFFLFQLKIKLTSSHKFLKIQKKKTSGKNKYNFCQYREFIFMRILIRSKAIKLCYLIDFAVVIDFDDLGNVKTSSYYRLLDVGINGHCYMPSSCQTIWEQNCLQTRRYLHSNHSAQLVLWHNYFSCKYVSKYKSYEFNKQLKQQLTYLFIVEFTFYCL